MCDDVLRLFVGNSGSVWMGGDDSIGVDTGLPVSDFLQEHRTRLNLATRVRIVGEQRSAALILNRIEETVIKKAINQSVELCSPAGIKGDPLDVLQQLWIGPVRSHLLTSHDYCSYALAHELNSSQKLTEKANKILRYHPAWPVVSFVSGYNPMTVAKFLVLVGDPRWFYHPDRPNRLTKLYHFLRLNPLQVKAVLDGMNDSGFLPRTALAINVWMTPKSNMLPDTSHFSFFWKIAKQQKWRKNPHIGILNATRKFIALVWHFWLSRISNASERKFIPELFFGDDRETIVKFNEHVKRETR